MYMDYLKRQRVIQAEPAATLNKCLDGRREEKAPCHRRQAAFTEQSRSKATADRARANPTALL